MKKNVQLWYEVNMVQNWCPVFICHMFSFHSVGSEDDPSFLPLLNSGFNRVSAA